MSDNIEMPIKELNPQEQVRRFVLIIEALAADANTSVSKVCKKIGITAGTVSQRKSQTRGKRGVSSKDLVALSKAGVDVSILLDDKPYKNIRDFLPKEPLQIPKTTSRKYPEMADEIANIREDCVEMKRMIGAIYKRLGETDKKSTKDPQSEVRRVEK